MAWIFSHTIVIDLFYELKLFDIMSIIAVVKFYPKIARLLARKDTTKKFLLLILLCVTFSSFLTFARTIDLEWAIVVLLRWWRLLSYLAIFLIIRYGNFARTDHEKFMLTILVSCVLQAILILLQKMELVPILWSGNELYYNEIVPSGTLGLNHVNHVIFMTIGLAAAVAYSSLASRRKHLRTVVAMTAAALLVAAMFAGEARLTFVALAVFGLVLLKTSAGWKYLLMTVAMIVVVGIVTNIHVVDMAEELWSHQFETKVERRQAQGAEGFQSIDPGRDAIFNWTINTILERPDYLIIGIGYQNFRSAGGPVSAHNTYFQVLIELGVIGFVAWMGFFLVLYRNLSEAERRAASSERDVILAGKAALLAIAACGLFNDTLYPVRNNNGFLGFALAFFAITSSGVWQQAGVQSGSAAVPRRTGSRRFVQAQPQRTLLRECHN